MSINFTSLLGLEKPGKSWWVVLEHVERVFTSMEPTGVCLDRAFVGVGFTDFKLVPPTLEIFVSPFEGVLDDVRGIGLPCFCGFCFHITDSVLCLSDVNGFD